ncbi:MAG: hypothetical protein ACRD59_04390 [Candidatus Acidiferrales bacterium]
MRTSMRGVSLVSAMKCPAVLSPAVLSCGLLACALVCTLATPAFASGSGDEKAVSPLVAAAKASTASTSSARPDSDRKVFTNDDIDRMWPKAASASTGANAAPQPARAAAAEGRVAAAPLDPQRDPLWYAQQIDALTAELDGLAEREARLRDFRATGDRTGLRSGLDIYAPCEGITTDNQVQNLAIRRGEIQAQLASLEDTAQRNDLDPGVIRDAPAILAASQKQPTAGELRESLEARHERLAAELSATRDELAGMSDEAAAHGATLQQPTAGRGGNMTTDLIQTLDRRAREIAGELEK